MGGNSRCLKLNADFHHPPSPSLPILANSSCILLRLRWKLCSISVSYSLPHPTSAQLQLLLASPSSIIQKPTTSSHPRCAHRLAQMPAIGSLWSLSSSPGLASLASQFSSQSILLKSKSNHAALLLGAFDGSHNHSKSKPKAGGSPAGLSAPNLPGPSTPPRAPETHRAPSGPLHRLSPLPGCSCPRHPHGSPLPAFTCAQVSSPRGGSPSFMGK